MKDRHCRGSVADAIALIYGIAEDRQAGPNIQFLTSGLQHYAYRGSLVCRVHAAESALPDDPLLCPARWLIISIAEAGVSRIDATPHNRAGLIPLAVWSHAGADVCVALLAAGKELGDNRRLKLLVVAVAFVSRVVADVSLRVRLLCIPDYDCECPASRFRRSLRNRPLCEPSLVDNRCTLRHLISSWCGRGSCLKLPLSPAHPCQRDDGSRVDSAFSQVIRVTALRVWRGYACNSLWLSVKSDATRMKNEALFPHFRLGTRVDTGLGVVRDVCRLCRDGRQGG